MGRTYRKLMRRDLRSTGTRFLSILAIVVVGAGFLAGLLATTPDMQDTADKYYSDYSLFDVDVRGTLGMTEADVEALAALDTVEQAMGAYVTDLNMESDAGSYVTRIYGVPLDKHGSGSLLNDFKLVEGRMPENPGECLIASPNGFLKAHHAGESFRISDDNTDYESLLENYNFTELKAVGVVQTPYYMSMESEPSTVGTGSIGLVIFVYPECYALDVYTDVFLTAAGGRDLGTFTQAYQDKIEALTQQLEDFGLERCQIRYNEIMDEGNAALADAQAEYDDAEESARQELEEARNTLDDGWRQLESGQQSLYSQQQQLNESAAQLDAAKSQAEAQAQQAREQLQAMEDMMPQEQYQAALEQIEAQLQAGVAEIQAGYTQLTAGQRAIAQAQAQLAESRAELEQGEADYTEAKEKAEEELSDAQAKIDDARAELADVEVPEWYVTDRSDTTSYASYKSNSEKVAAIARVFPVFFFLVAALVALTTMTRMVEEERVQIGTLKALGYSNGKIAAYYLGYSVVASTLGSILGCVVGFYLLPLVISTAYGMMYTLPRVLLSFRWNYAVLIVPISIGCTTLATLAACINELREKPASLMLPKAPKAGKRIFLEHIRPLWRRLRFTQKVAARNIFRYKKRLYMTVLGIAGCTALLLTGFGLRDSMHDIVDKQFGEIYKYNLSIYVKDGQTAQTDAVIQDVLTGEAVSSHALFHYESGSVENGGKSEKVNIFVPKETAQLKEQFTLRGRRSGADIPFREDSLILTEKTCEQLGVQAGSQVTLQNADGKKATFTVSAVTENYVAGYAFISSGTYQTAFGTEPEYKLILAQAADQSLEAREALSKEILQSDDVLLVQFTQTIRDSFQNTVKSIDYIVIVLILSAGLLAIVVLYNLTNINISERKKELATVKVLGFHENEVAAYIYRETTVLCILGILLGFLLGLWLHGYVVRTAEVDAVMFGRHIKWQSFLYAALVTGFFTALVDLFMLGKLKKIDMVESMKANE